MKAELGDQEPHVLIHQSIDVESEQGQHLVGLRAEFLEPNRAPFNYTDIGQNLYKVELKQPVKLLSNLHLDSQPLDENKDLKAFHTYSKSHGFPFSCHRWPPNLVRNSNRYLTPFKMVRNTFVEPFLNLSY